MVNNTAIVYGSKVYEGCFRPDYGVKDLHAQVTTWNQKISTLYKDMKLLFKISVINVLAMGIFATCFCGVVLGSLFFLGESAALFMLEPWFVLGSIGSMGALTWLSIWRRELSQIEFKINQEIGENQISYKEVNFVDLVTAEEFSEIAHFFGCEESSSEEEKLSFFLTFKSLPYEKTYQYQRSGGKLNWLLISPISLTEQLLIESKEQEVKDTYKPWFDFMLDLARAPKSFMRPEDRQQVGQAIVQLIHRADTISEKANKTAFFQRIERSPLSVSCYCDWETDRPILFFKFPRHPHEFLENPSAQEFREILKKASLGIPAAMPLTYSHLN